MPHLGDLGWDEAWEDSFQPMAARGLLPGRVTLEDKHAFVLATHQGESSARVAGRLLHATFVQEELPKVGDWVAYSQKPADSRAVIQQVLPRRTFLARKMAGREAAPQVLAANIDLAFIVQAADSTFNPRRLERFLVMVHEGGAKAVVILNKADASDELDAYAAAARASVGKSPLVIASALTGRGLDELRGFLAPGRTCVFVGTSGVGKSSLINGLYGEAIQATLEVREHDAKGRHTTTWRELIVLPAGGVVIDTPGMREFHMWLVDDGLDQAFPDIAQLALQCHFRACHHAGEKRCAVQAALADGRLAPDRFASFQKLRRELAYLATERRDHTYQLRRRHAGQLRRYLHQDIKGAPQERGADD